MNTSWNLEIENLKNFFGAQDEFEIYTGNFSKLIKLERKKKMSAEVVQQRIVNSLICLKKRFEQQFFDKLSTDDKELFYSSTSRKKMYSKYCKLRASVWYIICYMINPEQIEMHKFKAGSFCDQLFSLMKKKSQSKSSSRGTARNFFNQENSNIGLAWFIIGEVLLSIKSENKLIKQKPLSQPNEPNQVEDTPDNDEI